MPKNNRMKKPLISEHATKLAEKIKEAKSKGNREPWKMLEKEETKSARNDKNRYLEQKYVEMESEGARALRKSFRK